MANLEEFLLQKGPEGARWIQLLDQELGSRQGCFNLVGPEGIVIQLFMVVGLIGLLGLEQLVVSFLQALPDSLLSQSRIGVLKMVLVIGQL